MSRPSTDWPSTRVSITGEGTVVEVEVVVDVDVDDVVVGSSVVDVDDVVELVVDGEVPAGEVIGMSASGVSLGLAVVGVVAVPSEAHPNSNAGATRSASRIDRRQNTGGEATCRPPTAGFEQAMPVLAKQRDVIEKSAARAAPLAHHRARPATSAPSSR